jgi:hypothetical protein
VTGLGALLLIAAAGCFAMHIRNSFYLERVTAFIFDGPGDAEAKAKELAHFVALQGTRPVDPASASFVARLEHRLPLELSPVTVLKEGFAFPDARRCGPCGQMCRTIRAAAWLWRIPSHKVLLGTGAGEHSMVALYANGAYRLFDPTFDFYWTDRGGHVATIEEVRDDPGIFAQVYRRFPHYPYRLDGATYFRWSRLGPPGRWLRFALTAVMGQSWVAKLDTPKLYERPWWGYGWLCTMGGVLCAALFAAAHERRHA